MAFPDKATVDAWRTEWTDRFVRLKPGHPIEYARFAGKVGRVITVNYGGRAIVDFADGAWYDIPDFATILESVTDPAEQKSYDPTVNSAQKNPVRQS